MYTKFLKCIQNKDIQAQSVKVSGINIQIVKMQGRIYKTPYVEQKVGKW